MPLFYFISFSYFPQLSTKLNQFDNHGDLPLDIAIKDRQTSIAATLLEHKADPDAKDSKGWTLLHRAVERGKVSLKIYCDYDHCEPSKPEALKLLKL